GYDSHEGFTRSFKAYMGISPKEYRKYNLTSISQNKIKEKTIMSYSKTTDEIVKGLNSFVAQAKETASHVRKAGTPFWDAIALKTDKLADMVGSVLSNITSIADNPDEITNRFSILGIIEDAAFESNILACGVSMTVARSNPEHKAIQEPIRLEYIKLAGVLNENAGRTLQFLNELTTLIIEDMRKSSIEKINEIKNNGQNIIDSIDGYDYIKNEITALVKGIEDKPIDEVSALFLDDCLFKLNIIIFAAEVDEMRQGGEIPGFKNLTVLKDSLSDAISFFDTLVKPESGQNMEHTADKQLEDYAFMCNILSFFLRGELDGHKLGSVIDETQKISFNEICNSLDSVMNRLNNSTDTSNIKEIANRLYGVKADLITQADILGDKGGVIEYLSFEIGNVAERVDGIV
ncbi:MAG: hypothetical protein FWD44_05850, partial [Oscillospiraceae bacterium]|nr:hypothetical protein [Oscillospiraceae bacterium]